MPNQIDTDFCAATYSLESQNVALDRCINMYPESVERGQAKNKYSLIQMPGTLAAGTVGNQWNGVFGYGQNAGGSALIVCGRDIYNVTSSLVITHVGTLPISPPDDKTLASGFEWISTPGGIVICIAGGVYIINPTGFTITPITIPVTLSPNSTIAFLDGRMFVVNYGTQQFYYSAVGDVTNVPGANVASKEGEPDFLTGVLQWNELLFFFGQFATEIWTSTGNYLNPVQRISSGGVLEWGAVGPWAYCSLGASIIVVARDRKGTFAVFQNNGLQWTRVSTYAIEQYLNNNNQYLFSLTVHPESHDGHMVAVLALAPSLVTVNTTQFIYDTTEGLWHERAIITSGHYVQAQSRFGTGFYDATSVGGVVLNGGGILNDNKVYLQGNKYATFNGTNIQVQRDWAHFVDGSDRLQYNQMILDLDSTLAPGDTVDLIYSEDGGQTYGNTHTCVANGGQDRVIFRQLGSGRDRAFRMLCISAHRKIFAAGYFQSRRSAP